MGAFSLFVFVLGKGKAKETYLKVNGIRVG
jgi:hypothetical protein